MKNKIIILSALMLPLLASIALACSCIYYETTKDKLDNAEYVFTGKAVDIKISRNSANQEMQEITMQIMNPYKPSNFPESVNLMLYAIKDTGADCGYNFVENKEYLIYAYTDQETNKLTTNVCMGNVELNKAQNEIEDLNELTGQEPSPTPQPQEQNIFERFFSWLKNLFS